MSTRSDVSLPQATARTDTVLDRLIEHLRARDAAIDGQERAAAILWTDPKGEWRPAIDLMLEDEEGHSRQRRRQPSHGKLRL